MRIITKGYAVTNLGGPFQLYSFDRHPVEDHDIHVEILYCGVCHSDVKMIHSAWDLKVNYPIVPGHEIVGIIRNIGKDVNKFEIGDYTAIGTYVDSCRNCQNCSRSMESYCKNSISTYNSPVQNIEQYTKGGFSFDIVVHENYAFKIPHALHNSLSKVAPLMCAGVTVFSPMLYHRMMKPGVRIGVIGLGGLGHMAVKFGVAALANVTVISTSEHKRKDALDVYKANAFVCSTNIAELSLMRGSLDFIIDTAPYIKDINLYLPLLDTGGIFVVVGLPTGKSQINCSCNTLVMNRQSVTGSLTGSLKDHQVMLDFCAQHNITSEVQLICWKQLDEAFECIAENRKDTYRYVLDLQNSKMIE